MIFILVYLFGCLCAAWAIRKFNSTVSNKKDRMHWPYILMSWCAVASLAMYAVVAWLLDPDGNGDEKFNWLVNKLDRLNHWLNYDK